MHKGVGGGGGEEKGRVANEGNLWMRGREGRS